MFSRLQSVFERDRARLLMGLGLFGLTFLFLLTYFVRIPLIYDEAPYLKPVALIKQYGLSLQFLNEYPEPAGLLHSVLHWALEPITGLRPPFVRMVNPVLLTITMVLTALTLRLVGSTTPEVSSLTLLGIPFTWVVSGMTLTEMPSILLTSLSVYLLVVATKNGFERWFLAIMIALIGGVTLGLAFLNRAMVLVVLGALPCLLFVNWRHSWRVVAAFALGAMMVAGPIMVIWGGLVPPHSAVPFKATSFSAHNMILSVAYAATVMAILAPSWFSLNVRLGFGIFIAIFALNMLSPIIEISVMQSVVVHLPTNISMVVPRLAGSLMMALAVLFVVSSFKNIYARPFDPLWLFLCVSMLLLIVAPGKIVHQYSSRYTMMAAGMIILASDPFATTNGWRVLRFTLGMLIGLASLISYYESAT